MTRVLCVDFGSTCTKAALVDADDETLVETGTTAATIGSDVLDGYRALRAKLRGERIHEVLACSSAGGGLRLAVVGYEQAVTAEAGRRVGLSAGARVVHVAAGELTPGDVELLQAARPDIVLLVGGTDGGNSEALQHNARRLGIARMPVPVVLAGNADAADDAVHELASRGRRVVVTDNVLPRIGVLDPGPARAAIREVFLRHVIGGKGLSRGPQLRRMIRGATPDAVLAGAELLADLTGAGVLVVDVGGATTDVYSALVPDAESESGPRRDVAGTLWRSPTLAGDLRVGVGAPGVVAAAAAEKLPVPDISGGRPFDAGTDRELAAAAAVIALRRHARGHAPGPGQPRVG